MNYASFLNGKLSYDDKMGFQTLRQQRLGPKTIMKTNVGTSRSTREIASELGISERSVRRIAKVELNLAACRRIPAQVLSASVKQKRLDRCNKTG